MPYSFRREVIYQTRDTVFHWDNDQEESQEYDSQDNFWVPQLLERPTGILEGHRLDYRWELRNVFSNFGTLLHSPHTHLNAVKNQILSRDKWAVGDENSLPLSILSLQTPDWVQHERPFFVGSQCCPVWHEIFAQLRVSLDSKTYVSHKT